ncbi:MAG: helix-turn-helix transcriptional regulator [Lactobacillaceae bacterium]|jgi:transcriptional regulator with XRE-family HTH domain|nr:helix-turn-helix transcriptional regulator [Lactobacillaceae bacterium]
MIIRGILIKERRELLGISQQTLAKGICHQSLISRLEKTNHITSMTILQQVCRRLELKFENIVSWGDGDQVSLEHIREAIAELDFERARALCNNKKFKTILPAYAMAEYHLLFGQVENADQNYLEALSHFEFARGYITPEQKQIMLEVETELAGLWMTLDDLTKAKDITQMAHTLIESMRHTSRPGRPDLVARVYRRTAEIAMREFNWSEALVSIRKARELIPKMMLTREVVILNFLEGKIKQKMDMTHESCHSFIKAYSTAEQIGDTSLMEDIHPYLQDHHVSGLFAKPEFK